MPINNGYIDTFRFSTIETYIKKIIKLKKRYQYTQKFIQIDDDTKIEFDDKNASCYILIDGIKIIKYSYHHFLNTAKIIFSAGIHKNTVHFVTKNKVYRNKKTIKSIEKKLEQSFEKIFKIIISNETLYDICILLDKINQFRNKYDFADDSIKINEQITLLYGNEKNVDFYCIININGNNVIMYMYDTMFASDEKIKFLTKNSEVNTKQYVEVLAKKISDALPDIEEMIKSKSDDKFKID